ncbi:UDP-N-acetylmuramoyl-L-alanyl-D-glutamate--2,6-diaminopimelate ligase [Pseudactinotalea sp. HY160]|uniref:UDP-N-acetylmuramoyl-L-alanyl-D-glutamate--2, 6-diaminopimelate ligase n=1 Tax=Pseudactinotalea sp. HY160 TaxID=2654490 RepID=UPI00128D3BAC|nr:UDP-N-acetylmuramoyl-L-alanyl-D-glutamate--2,6-diaminopimelate ligase [Pseudactinotalea sp. HY160]MPV51304.1 UDP-N-acetylmuramoyl-L-alanyl-D-glutamate--2,6-diaminopimelate ligase [Pseudactinotalea sp. HY160]
MNLSDLAALLGADDPESGDSELEVANVSHNARWVQADGAYVAIRGARSDGHSFIREALGNGAVTVIGEGLPEDAECDVPYLRVDDARTALADAATALAGYPSHDFNAVGVTGTDGKTTTTWLIRHLHRHSGLPTGLLSTVGYELPDGELEQFPAHFTTPEAPELQTILAEERDAGAHTVVVEASSHALAMKRLRGVQWDTAVWTNLTAEHLDFHGTIHDYFEAKATLVREARFAVLNADDPWTDKLRGEASAGEWTYSATGGDADWVARGIEDEERGIRFTVESPLGSFSLILPMIGRFNVSNALAALAAGARTGLRVPELVAGVESFPGVPGRMEIVPSTPEDPRVIVDFAHTPPSLEKALATVRATTAGSLWVVIGSAGGPRDPYKRAPLGEVATRLADHAVFTEEDHRDTPLQHILTEMAAGAGERTNFHSIGDRGEAIRFAISSAAPTDTVVLAGKGPEPTLERDNETIPWNEVEEASAALRQRQE